MPTTTKQLTAAALRKTLDETNAEITRLRDQVQEHPMKALSLSGERMALQAYASDLQQALDRARAEEAQTEAAARLKLRKQEAQALAAELDRLTDSLASACAEIKELALAINTARRDFQLKRQELLESGEDVETRWSPLVNRHRGPGGSSTYVAEVQRALSVASGGV